MVGTINAFPVCYLATHRATYFERIIRIIPRVGKEECKYGMGKQVKGVKDALVASSYVAGKDTLKMLQELYREDWSIEMVACHTVGVKA